MTYTLQAGLLNLKNRVPMYRLFLRIFLWFWVTSLGTLSLVWIGNRVTESRKMDPPNLFASVAPILAAEAIHAYEAGGPQAFARFSQSSVDDKERRLYLLDGFYKDVLSRPVSDDGLRVARAAKIGKLIFLRGHVAAYKSISPAGRPYILVLYIHSGLGKLEDMVFGNGIVFVLAVLLLVTLLSFRLAYQIASPIYGIQAAARKVARGDLKARVPAFVLRRHDELASLGEDFDSMVDRLEALIESQRNLLSSVSHELRSPLARISLSVGLLRDRPLADNGDTLQRLERDVSRIDLLMGQLLTLSRLEAGLSFDVRTDVDLSQLIEEVVADGNFEAQSSEKSVTFRGAHSLIVSQADPHALRSACENIVRNAIRFAPPGTDVEVVLMTNESASDKLAVLTVRDHGPGVPEESLQSIFQPFIRIVEGNGTVEGNGLGLTIAWEAIRVHRGTISATNCSPRGLEVKLQLPLGQSSTHFGVNPRGEPPVPASHE